MSRHRGTTRSLATMVVAASACAAVLLAGGASARAEVPAPVEGPWSGVSFIGLPVRFTVEGGDVLYTVFRFHWAECGDFTSNPIPALAIDPEGHWGYAPSGGQAIEGTFVSPERVEGTITTISRMTPGCDGTKESFVAIPGEVPPPNPVQYYATVNAITGSQRRRPEALNLGKHLSLFQMHWHDWGKRVTFGNGRAAIRVSGREWNPKVKVRLSHPIHDGPDKRLYSMLRFSLQGRLPRHYPRTGWLKFDDAGLVSSSDRGARKIER